MSCPTMYDALVSADGGCGSRGALGGPISLILPFRLFWGIFWVTHHTTSNHNVTSSDRLKAYEWSGRVYAIGGAP
jgi:hypothetical protein